MTQEEFAAIDKWGYVTPGTNIVDRQGNRYIVSEQNDAGFLALTCVTQSNGKHQDKAFESLDAIDHAEYRIAEP